MGGGKTPERGHGIERSRMVRRRMQESEMDVEIGEEREQVGERLDPEQELIERSSEDSARTTETVRRRVSSCTSPDGSKELVGGEQKKPSEDKKRICPRCITAFSSEDKPGSVSTWRNGSATKSFATLERVKKSIYYAPPEVTPESLDMRVQMCRWRNRNNLEASSDLNRLLSHSSNSTSSPDRLGNEITRPGKPRKSRGPRQFDGFSERHNVEGADPKDPSEEASWHPVAVDPPNGEDVEGDGENQHVADETWRPGDDIIPPTASDYQPIPNFIPRFNPNEVTTLSAIRDLESRLLLRFKKRYRSLFSFASLRNHHAVSSRQSKVNNHAHRWRWLMSLRPDMHDASDIIKRKNGLTGRRLMVGSTEIRILPKINREKLLYYLMDVGDGLQITVNDLGKWHLDAYPEYKDDLWIMRWLIDTRACRGWSFTVDNLCCKECVSSWRIKRKSRKIKASVGRQTRFARIRCSHSTKIKKFFLALGAKHTSRMRNIKLLVSAENCLNPETISSAVHTLTTTFPTLEKVEVEFQRDVGLLPGRMLRTRRRRSIVRSLQHLEKWVAAGDRLKVSGLENHPRLVSSWNEAKRGWYYDADRTVRFLWESRQREMKRGASSL